MTDEFRAGTTTVTGHDGERIEAYAATPVAATGAGGVVVIHHMPGFDEATKEIVRRFASWGYAAVAPNLHHREAPGAAPDDAAAANRAAGGVSDERLVGDVSGAVERLRGVVGGNGAVGVIGFCSGGRQSLLAACSLDLDAAVDCYGAFAFSDPPADSGRPPMSLADRLPDLSCPLLGLFGADDTYPGPVEVSALDAQLSELGKAHEFHTFDGASHAFFAVDRPSYRVDAATAGWELVRGFFGDHLGAPQGWGR